MSLLGLIRWEEWDLIMELGRSDVLSEPPEDLAMKWDGMLVSGDETDMSVIGVIAE
jgi:hypothetical protein